MHARQNQQDLAWPAEALQALAKVQGQTASAGCGGCPHAEWAGQVSVHFDSEKKQDRHEFKFHVAACHAGVCLGARTDGLLNAVPFCTARNKPLGEAVAHQRLTDQSAHLAPTLRPSPLGR